jgi:hypothetical protein
MFPSFRGHPLIQEGVSYWYLATCLTQAGWAFASAFEVIWLSMVFLAALFITLFVIAYRQYYQFNNTEKPEKCCDFWLFILPFTLHFGWIICATLLNVNIVVVNMQQPAAVQLCVGIICLAVLHAVALWALYFPARANYTLPCVIAWANGAIASQLTNPRNLIASTFSDTITEAVRLAAASICIIVLILIGSRLVLSRYYRKLFGSTGASDTVVVDKEEFFSDHNGENGVNPDFIPNFSNQNGETGVNPDFIPDVSNQDVEKGI